ncbi:MAG: PQQ-binding-like beta-propeller repeat protein [Candidatus Krumholzibacteriota bacterium]|nr:PQQ-binding-like beta-propeller repeat protein [Candidatus Krumholzibacteriota bacterium]
MKKTAFVCLGSDGYDNAFVYQELPRRSDGEEFFVFVSPGDPSRGPALRRLFRDAISDSRLGSPSVFFARLVERLETAAGGTPVDELMAGILFVAMIRRGEEIHLLRGKDCVAIHRNAVTGEEGPLASACAVAEVPLRAEREQKDLFSTFAEDLFVLERFRLPAGRHALVFVPSREFIERNRRVLGDSVFFPSFEAPDGRGVDIKAERTFPALCWDLHRASAGTRSRAGLLRRIPLPAAVGAIAAVVAVLLIFGPWFRGGGETPAGTNVLLSAADDPAGTIPSPEAEEPADDPPTEETVAPAAVAPAIDLGESWKKKFPAPVTSSPVVDGDRIYFGCRDGNLYAYNPNGTFAWKHESGEGIGAIPVLAGGRVIGANYAGRVFCLDAETGAPRWTFEAGARVVSRPYVTEGLVIVGTMTGRLTALQIDDGSEAWSQSIGTEIWAGVAGCGNAVLAATTDGALVKLTSAGEIVWRAKPGGGIRTTPLCMEEDGIVVFGTSSGYIYGYTIDSGDLMWRFGAGHPVNGSPTAGGRTIVVGADDGTVFALDRSGRLLWKKDAGGAIKSTPAVGGGAVFVTTYGSRLVAIDLATGKAIDEYTTASPVYSSPAIGGERIFFGSNGGVLYALSLHGSG